MDVHNIASATGGRSEFSVTAEEEAEAKQRASEDLSVPSNFTITAIPYKTGDPLSQQPVFAENPQTVHFGEIFGLPADFRKQARHTNKRPAPSPALDDSAGLFSSLPAADEEIDLGDD